MEFNHIRSGESEEGCHKMLLVLNLGVVSGLSRENILKPWKPDPRLFEASAYSLGFYLTTCEAGAPPKGCVKDNGQVQTQENQQIGNQDRMMDNSR